MELNGNDSDNDDDIDEWMKIKTKAWSIHKTSLFRQADILQSQ